MSWRFRRRPRDVPRRTFGTPTLTELGALKPTPRVGTAAYQLPEDGGDAAMRTASAASTTRKDSLMPEDSRMPDENPDNVTAGPYGGDDPREASPADPRPVDLSDTGSHRIEPARADVREESASGTADDREDCPHCRGTGKILTTSDLLRASLTLLPTSDAQRDGLIAEFYRRLFAHAGYLAVIFPPDLADPDARPDGRGKAQRDKLLAALIALGSTYDPSDPEAMRVLDEHLALYGRSHAALPFPDGPRPPTMREYVIVGDVLFRLLREVVGEAWVAEFDAVWTEAYDYATRKMGDASWVWLQENGGAVHPRSVRR